MSVIETPFVYLGVHWLQKDKRKHECHSYHGFLSEWKNYQRCTQSGHYQLDIKGRCDNYFYNSKRNKNLSSWDVTTYEAAKNRITLSHETLRIVLTKNPNKYQTESIPGQLEFTNESPRELIKRLSLQGYSDMLLTGGPTINALFFKSGLINIIRLTVEPTLFPTGKNLIVENQSEIQLQLIKVQKLNKQGYTTLNISRYQIKYECYSHQNRKNCS